jgi:pSer/pThr/pTyr-binding forkhead associated (FHA) protein
VKTRVVVSVPLEEEGDPKEYRYEFQKEEITLGRHSRNDIQIPAPQVSSEHAKILVSGEELRIVDLGSQAGTLLDDTPVEAGAEVAIPPDSVITIAECTIRISLTSGDVTQEAKEKTQQVASTMVREVLAALGGESKGPYLEVMNDDEQGNTVSLPEQGEVIIGREKDCQLRLSHWSVSRHHARIRVDRRGTFVKDLGSKNGVMINETVIDSEVAVHDRDVVFVGHTQIRFHDPSDTLIDQLDDIPTPLPVDIKTTIIEMEEKKAPKKPPAKEKPSSSAGGAEPDTGPVDEGPVGEEPKKGRKKKAKAPAAPPPTDGGAMPAGLEDEVSGGLGDWLFVIVGIIVILGVAAAAVFLFVL